MGGEAAQTWGFAELALEAEEGREREQASAGAPRGKGGVGCSLPERKETRSGNWEGERTALWRRAGLK